MSENKFIKRLKGEQTAKSVLEIKNESAKTSFANMPQGTSNAINVYSDHRGNATAVLNGTTNWKVSNSDLLLADSVSGDGQDFTSTYSVSGAGLWVNASYTFPSTGDPRHPVAMVFNPSTKWVLKVCGDNLIVDGGSTVDFTMLVKIGTASVYSKNFTIRESAGQFSKEFIIDFGEANSDVVKAGGLSTLTVQLLCGTANASARIYNGMTVLTCLQRKVDASAVSNSSANVEDVLDGNMIPSDYFSNPAFIDQIEDGDTAVAIFARDGDDVNLDHWDQPIPDRTGNAGKFLQTPDGDKMSWEDVEISDITGLQTELNSLQGQITTNKNTMDSHIGNTNNPHSVTKAQVGLSNVDNTSDLNKPISTATQNALDLKADKSTTYTKTETDTLLDAKQDTISDLSTIRSNAQAGKAASDTIATYGDIVTHDVAEFATAAQGAKADTALQAGDNVSELVNDAGYITGITGLDVTTALGYTPYNSSNPSGYQANVIESIKVNGTAQTITAKAVDITVPTKTSDITNDSGFITSSALVPYALSADLATVATSGDYDDLSNKPTIPTVGNGTITITQGGISKGTFTTNQSGNATIDLDAGGSGSYHPDLFDVKWSDHICNDVQWLRADTFSWQDGTVYEEAYQHLLDDALTSVAASETIAGTQIRYLLAQDGHKIVDPTEESNVVAIYNATGVAWYYIVDPTNHRFKLPRTKFGFTGIRSGVGKYVAAGLPNITAKVQFTGDTNAVAGGGAAYATADSRYHDIGGGGGVYSASSVLIDASEQNAIYGNSDTVQPKATEMYLYFYVGNFTQTALENTAGITTEELNDKLDLDAGNATNITKKTIVGWGMPDYTAGISLDGRSTPYTAPQDGIISIERNLGTIKVNDNYIATSSQTYSSYSVIFPVSKDDVVSWTTGNIYLGVFYPFKGVN